MMNVGDFGQAVLLNSIHGNNSVLKLGPFTSIPKKYHEAHLNEVKSNNKKLFAC